MDLDYDALRRVFAQEFEEQCAQIEAALLLLERRPDDLEAVHTIFRAAHSIKGNASTLGFPNLAELGHALEDVLERVRARALAVDRDLITCLLGAVDVLRRRLPPALAGETEAGVEEQALLQRLRRHAQGSAPPEAAAPAETAPAPTAMPNPRARSLRIDIDVLERLLELAGEASVARARLRQLLGERAAHLGSELLETFEAGERVHLEMQDLVLKARMVPIGPVFRRFTRSVRDLSQAAGKLVRLEFEGEQTELDVALVEHVRDPLVHMVRNAIDHGIEAPALRRAAGKDPTGTLCLRARHEAGSVVVEVLDDGAGVPRARLRERAAALGLIHTPAELADAELLELVFQPGVSTAEQVGTLSGRGVGMDVVRRNAEALQGTVELESVEGTGTCVSLRLPLTLAIIAGFTLAVGTTRYLLPIDVLAECAEWPAGQQVAPRGVFELRGEPIPYLRLRDLFEVREPEPAEQKVAIVYHGSGRVGLVVDSLLGTEQTVVKPLGRLLRDLPGLAGSAILGDGRVALILDVPGLLRQTLGRGRAVMFGGARDLD
jgi:two-component system chemotaxis sensor kinase CheA